MPEKFKFKIKYSEKYKKNYAVVRKSCLPKSKDLPFLSESEIVRVELLEAGFGEQHDGKKLEFQVVKIYLELV